MAQVSLTAHEESSRAAPKQMLHGRWIMQSIYVAAKSRIADALGDGAKTCEELAPSVDESG